MSEGALAAVSAVQVKKLKLAVAGKCERCSGQYPFPVPEIHYITGLRRIGEGGAPGPLHAEENMLILCPACRRDAYLLPVPETDLADLVRNRPRAVKEGMKRILGHRPLPLPTPRLPLPLPLPPARGNRPRRGVRGIL